MAAPSPALVVSNPPPLNPTSFPFRVDAFPAEWIAKFGRLIPLLAQGEPAPRPANRNRKQD